MEIGPPHILGVACGKRRHRDAEASRPALGINESATCRSTTPLVLGAVLQSCRYARTESTRASGCFDPVGSQPRPSFSFCT